ncbi:MAG: hypothetical protein CMJ89_17850 [Planctomycetes bacterium]|jgi:GT2 family glycosyltransferase|nr:hypothetical protein [Planctomycetota bacterium]
MKHDVSLAALVVNYNTGCYALSCVESLIQDWERAGRERSKLSVILIDNASPEDQEHWLVELEGRGVEVIRSEENLGYAGGLNVCYEASKKAPTEAVAYLNPDLIFLPGSTTTLLDYIFDHPLVGAVDPDACIDALGTFRLPRNLLPTAVEHCRLTLARLHPFFARTYSKLRLKKSMEWWTATEPISTNMLSGCCLFLRREVVEKLGRAMDPRYPLYFEDTDLFLTLKGMGFQLVHHPGARILHHWSRSARIQSPDNTEPNERFEVSRREYHRKFFSPLGRALVRWIDKFEAGWPKEKMYRPMLELRELGEFEQPLEIQLPRSCRFLIEFAVDPSFPLCCGVLGEGERWVCPPESWEWFFPLPYFGRVIDLDTGEVLLGLSFRKVGAFRTDAMSLTEIDSLGERLLSLSPARSA